MDTKILDKKINKAQLYNLYLILGLFILFLAAAVIAIQMAGVFNGSEDEEIVRLVTIGVTISSVLLTGWSLHLMSKKKNYSDLLKVDEEEVGEIIEDINNLELNTATFALGKSYVYFYGELTKNPRKLICVKYEEITCAEFAKWRSNEQIFFYDNNDEWVATVGGYKKKSQTIKSILSSKGVSIK